MNKTPIEWADFTWNPLRGCRRVSPGCRLCYAEKRAARFSAGTFAGFAVFTEAGPRWTGRIALIEKKLSEPFGLKMPSMIFPCSMSDWAHEDLADSDRDRIYAVMALANKHLYLMLTKRTANGRRYLNDPRTPERIERAMLEFHESRRIIWPLPNVWQGFSAENYEYLNSRMLDWVHVETPVRWLSYEPALGSIAAELNDWLAPRRCIAWNWWKEQFGELTPPDYSLIDWIVAGGESGGVDAQPAHPAWFRAVRDRCERANVPFLFKQWGSWRPVCALYADPGRGCFLSGRGRVVAVEATGAVPECEDASRLPNSTAYLMEHVSKGVAGRTLDGEVHHQYPQQMVGWLEAQARKT